ncbi:hypothetical protein [Bifidobacterium pseudolongum]|uniref:hypothetical protein n=1 Tax=Bifidobacterium pseudolongum TaxID=1694 RepID=UPI0010E7D8E4|nr:hypothetical protein [Bifidobacterium pseudolongum]RYQ65451.1 hypothetical protein PG2103B_1675 [Bifidobacterium pseudolongum subsp. globosum]
MNEVIIDAGMMGAIDLAAEELWEHVRPSDEYEEGEGIYFICVLAICVPHCEQCFSAG